MTVRPVRQGDIPALVDVFVRAFQDGYAGLLPPDVLAGVTATTVTGWFDRWTGELATAVAVCGGAPAGFVRYGDDVDDPDPRAGYIGALYVHPDVAGHGIGRKLLEHAVASLTDQHKSVVTLWVFRDNARARNLYASAGFTPDGTEATDPQWRVPQIRLRRELPQG